jgi:hypothetical protein
MWWHVQQEMPYILSKYGAQALLNEGYKVCTLAARGVSVDRRIDQIEADLPMSDSAAVWVDVLAPDELGC